MPVVSITRSARERSGSSNACSEATPAATLPSAPERVATAGLLVARRERLLGGLEEEHVMGDAECLQVVHDRCQRLEVDAAAHVGDDRRTLDLGALVHEQLDKRADHLRRLAHTVPGARGAYMRASFLARRRELLTEWADLLLAGMPPAENLILGPRRYGSMAPTSAGLL